MAQVALTPPMEYQLPYDILGKCSDDQESPLDAEASILLLLALILFVNIGINLTTVVSDGWVWALRVKRAEGDSQDLPGRRTWSGWRRGRAWGGGPVLYSHLTPSPDVAQAPECLRQDGGQF